jgi:hypothetical protein
MFDFEGDYRVPLVASEGADVAIYVDNGLVELVTQRGTVWATNLYFPDDARGTVRVA